MEESPSTFLENADRSIRNGSILLAIGLALGSVWLYHYLFRIPQMEVLADAPLLALAAYILILTAIITYRGGKHVYDATDEDVVRKYREWKKEKFR